MEIISIYTGVYSASFRGCHIAVNRWNLLNDHNHLRIRLLKVGNKWEAI
jgi:hypothetical protein